MRSLYPSDISREKFEIIVADLESCRKKTKPRTLDLYDVFCGVSEKRLSVEQKSFQNGAIVMNILKNGVKNQAKIKKVFWNVF